MTRRGWIAIGGLSALAVTLAVALVISLTSDGDGPAGPPGFEQAGSFPPQGDQLMGPPGVPVDGPPEELRECLSDEGAELPSPRVDLGASDRRRLESAFEECAGKFPQGGPSPPGGMIEP